MCPTTHRSRAQLYTKYFEILKDTLIFYELPAWQKSKTRKPLASSKYYFFDVGVVATLQDRQYHPGTPEFGEAFETYLMHELTCYSNYISKDALSYWRTTSGFEVDFIIGDHTAVEVKAKKNISRQDLKSLRALAEEKKLKRYLCVSLEARARTVEGVTVLPYKIFLEELCGETIRENQRLCAGAELPVRRCSYLGRHLTGTMK